MMDQDDASIRSHVRSILRRVANLEPQFRIEAGPRTKSGHSLASPSRTVEMISEVQAQGADLLKAARASTRRPSSASQRRGT